MSSILFVRSSDLGGGCNPCRNIKMDWRGVVTLHMRHKNMNINVDIVCKKLFQQAIDLPVLQKRKSGLSGQYDRIILHKCQDATMEKLLWLLTPDAPVVIMIGKRGVTIPENMASHYLNGYNYIFPKEYSSHCAVTSELSKIAIGLLSEDEEEGSKSSPKTNQLQNRDTHSFPSWVHDSSTKDQLLHNQQEQEQEQLTNTIILNLATKPNRRLGSEEGAESGGSDSIHLDAVSDFVSKNGDNEKTHNIPSIGSSSKRYVGLRDILETSRTVSAAPGSRNIQQNIQDKSASQQNIPKGRSGSEEGAESGGSDSIHLNQSDAVSHFASKNVDSSSQMYRELGIANSSSPASQQNIQNEPNGRSGGEEGTESGGSDSIHLDQSNASVPSMGNLSQRLGANMLETSRTVSAASGSGNTLRKMNVSNSSSPASQQNIRNEPNGRSGSDSPEQAGSDSIHLNGFALENRDNNGTLTSMNNSSQRHMGSADMLNAVFNSGNLQQNRLRQIATSQQNIQNEPNGSEADPNSSNHPDRFASEDINKKIREPLSFIGNLSDDVSRKLSAASGGSTNSPMFLGKRPSSELNGWPSDRIYPDHQLINVVSRGGHESSQSNAVFRGNGDNDGGIEYDPPSKRSRTDSPISMQGTTTPIQSQTDGSSQHSNRMEPTAASSDVEERLDLLTRKYITNHRNNKSYFEWPRQ